MLEIEKIETYRGRAQILRQVSLSVGEKESVVLVGRNGAGKTTTIDTIIGLLAMRSGKITFQGKDISRLPPYRRARLGIGYAPEDSGLFPDLTVAENFQICRWLAEISGRGAQAAQTDRKSTRLNSSHLGISYAVFCLKKKSLIPNGIDVDRFQPPEA